MPELIKIDKNVPMPPKRAAHHRYPWRQMKVGDSFLVSPYKSSGSLHICARRCGIKIAQRREAEGFRVWRVK